MYPAWSNNTRWIIVLFHLVGGCREWSTGSFNKAWWRPPNSEKPSSQLVSLKAGNKRSQAVKSHLQRRARSYKAKEGKRGIKLTIPAVVCRSLAITDMLERAWTFCVEKPSHIFFLTATRQEQANHAEGHRPLLPGSRFQCFQFASQRPAYGESIGHQASSHIQIHLRWEKNQRAPT